MCEGFLAPLASRLPGAGEVAGGVVLAAAIVAALALLFRRRPDTFPLVAIFALPFRLPISAGGRTVNLLIPLYLVVAAATIALLLPEVLRRLRNGEAHDAEPPLAVESGAGASLRARWLSPRGVEWLLLASVALYALQTLYSADRGKAAENIAFFYVPFGLLFVLLRRVRWTASCCCAAWRWQSRWRSSSRGSASSSTPASRCS